MALVQGRGLWNRVGRMLFWRSPFGWSSRPLSGTGSEILALSIQWAGQVILKPAGLLSLGDPQRAGFLFLVEHVIVRVIHAGVAGVSEAQFPPTPFPHHTGASRLCVPAAYQHLHLPAARTLTDPPTGSPGPQGMARCQVRTFKTNMKLQASS